MSAAVEHEGENTQLNKDFVRDEVEAIDIDEAIEKGGCGWGTLLYTMGTFVFCCLEGAEVVMMTVVIPMLRCQWDLSSLALAVLLMSTILAMAISGAVTSTFGDRFGRKPIALAAAIGVTVTGVLCAFAQNYWQFLILRIIIGFFMGMGSGPAVVISGEVTPMKFRALAFSGMFVPWGIGVCISVGIAYLVIEPFGWPGLLLIVAITFSPCILFFGIMRESPRYEYYYRRKIKAAEETIKIIWKLNGITETSFKLKEHELLTNQQDLIDCKMIFKTLKQTNNIQNAVILFNLGIFTGFCFYLNAYMTPRLLNEGYCSDHTITVKESCNFDKSVLLDIGMVSFAGLVGCSISLILIEFFGRRKVFLFEVVIAIVCIFPLYFCVNYTFHITFLILARLTLESWTFAYTILTAEYMPTVIRSFMLSTVPAFCRFGGVIGSFSSEYIYQSSPRLGIALLQGSMVFCLICLLILKRETAGVHLS